MASLLVVILFTISGLGHTVAQQQPVHLRGPATGRYRTLLGFDSWATAPACSAPPTAGAKADSMGRLWGWEASKSCAFKDEQQQNVQAGQQPALQQFDSAPSCLATPSADNSLPDRKGQLWGVSYGKSCAFKTPMGTPAYYPGYSGPRFIAVPSPEPIPLVTRSPSPSSAALAMPPPAPTPVAPSPSVRPVTRLPTFAPGMPFSPAAMQSPSPSPSTIPTPVLTSPRPRPNPVTNTSTSPALTPALQVSPSPKPSTVLPSPMVPSPSPMLPSPRPSPSTSTSTSPAPTASTAPAPAPQASQLCSCPVPAAVDANALATTVAKLLWQKLADASNSYESVRTAAINLNAAAPNTSDSVRQQQQEVMRLSSLMTAIEALAQQAVQAELDTAADAASKPAASNSDSNVFRAAEADGNTGPMAPGGLEQAGPLPTASKIGWVAQLQLQDKGQPRGGLS